jgi:hypothetical protein
LHRVDGLHRVLVERHSGAEARTPGRFLSITKTRPSSLLYCSIYHSRTH